MTGGVLSRSMRGDGAGISSQISDRAPPRAAGDSGLSFAGLFVRLVPELNGWQINCWRGLFLALFLLAYLIAVYGRGWTDRFRAIPAPVMIACAGFFAQDPPFMSRR